MLYVWNFIWRGPTEANRRYMAPKNTGIWHAVIVVYGVGYSYGPDGVEKLDPDNNKYGKARDKSYLGETSISQEELEEFVSVLGNDLFRGSNYKLYDNNCCVFAGMLAKFLDVTKIPVYARKQTDTKAAKKFRKQCEKVLDSSIASRHLKRSKFNSTRE